MLESLKQCPEQSAAIDRVKEWTRMRFNLVNEVPILVAEVACGLPGCPPLETVVAFWTEDDRRHRFKLFKPAAAVELEDLPPSWMKNALVAVDEPGFECC
ncbi:MAG TPA: hypothetical protein VH678_20805 [Xanthobacteraceae bacterium]